MTLSELYQEWLNLKVLPSNKSEVTKSKYGMCKNVIIHLFGDRNISEIKSSENQQIMNKYGQKVSRKHLGRLNSNIKASINLAMADKVMIEDFTAYVELFSSKKDRKLKTNNFIRRKII